MSTNFAAFPIRDSIAVPVDPTLKPDKDGNITLPPLLVPRPWIDWLTALTTRVETTPNNVETVELNTQMSSIGTTPLPMDNFGAGLYRITYYARITRAGTVSSSLTVALGWTDGAVNCGYTGPALTTNTVNSVQGHTIMVRSDSPPVLTYATTYASVGATPMQYSLDIVAEVLT